MLSALGVPLSAPTAVSWLGAATGTRSIKILYDTSWTAFAQDHEPFAPNCVLAMPQNRSEWSKTFARAKSFF